MLSYWRRPTSAPSLEGLEDRFLRPEAPSPLGSGGIPSIVIELGAILRTQQRTEQRKPSPSRGGVWREIVRPQTRLT